MRYTEKKIKKEKKISVRVGRLLSILKKISNTQEIIKTKSVIRSYF